MYRKLLKKIVVCVMTAAVCIGVFVPMQAEAATKADVIGRWKNGPGGITTFHEDGTATDDWNTRAYHMESGTVTITNSDNSTETISFDLWRGETSPDSLEDSDGKRDACVFKLNGDGVMTGWNIYFRDNAVRTYGACRMERVDASSSNRKSREKSREEKEAEKKEAAEREAEKKALERASKESVRLEREAGEQGFVNGAQMQAAKAENKMADEYYNNAAVSTPGIENATPVAQGGSLIVNGKVTNMTASISKVSVAYVDSVRASQEGTVLNVVDVQFPATEATINFYMPGVVDGANIVAVQYIDGEWGDVEVVEVRADHVILNLKSNGVVAFLAR